jgi:hypothetical protein
MGNVSGVLEFSIAIIIAIILVITVYQITEKKKKKEIKKKFRNFSESYKISKKNLRAVPRIVLPSALEAILTFTDDDYFGLKAFVNDMSLSGFSVKPDFPLKRLPVNTVIKNTLVVTPINTFVVKEMKSVRIDHQIDKRLMAFYIQSIDEDQFDNLKQFIAYLDEFLKKKKEEEEYS